MADEDNKQTPSILDPNKDEKRELPTSQTTVFAKQPAPEPIQGADKQRRARPQKDKPRRLSVHDVNSMSREEAAGIKKEEHPITKHWRERPVADPADPQLASQGVADWEDEDA